jgi:hypothetical protein
MQEIAHNGSRVGWLLLSFPYRVRGDWRLHNSGHHRLLALAPRWALRDRNPVMAQLSALSFLDSNYMYGCCSLSRLLGWKVLLLIRCCYKWEEIVISHDIVCSESLDRCSEKMDNAGELIWDPAPLFFSWTGRCLESWPGMLPCDNDKHWSRTQQRSSIWKENQGKNE